MSKEYYVRVFISGEPDEEEFYKTQRDAMTEVEHLSMMQPENTYVVYENDGGECPTVKIAVIDNQIFLPM
jgi:hypothetical protein